MRALFRRFFDDRCGATAIEYALIATIVSLATIVGVISMSNAVRESYNSTGAAVTEAWTSNRP